jgi:cytoskeleton protein RodZ
MNEYRAMSNTDSLEDRPNENKKNEQNGNLFNEKHPNLTLLESFQNPGELLRTAREKAGYSLSDISAQTKINERQLEAIESGDSSRLPPETFAKAFIKSYCKALKIDPDPVILSFGFFENVSVQINTVKTAGTQNDAVRPESLDSMMPDSSKRLSTLNFDKKTSKKPLGYGVALAAIAVMAAFYIPIFISNSSSDNNDLEAGLANESSAVSVDRDAALLLGSNELSSQSNVELLGEGKVSELPAEVMGNESLSTEAPIFPALQNPSLPQPTQDVGVNSGATQMASTSSPTSTVNTQQTASTQVNALQQQQLANPSPSMPTRSTASVGSSGVLRFNFQEQSWVTVLDANDKVLVSKLNDGGSDLEIRGQAPFKLIVGNAQSVTVLNNGKVVDLSSSISGNEVARLTVQ